MRTSESERAREREREVYVYVRVKEMSEGEEKERKREKERERVWRAHACREEDRDGGKVYTRTQTVRMDANPNILNDRIIII